MLQWSASSEQTKVTRKLNDSLVSRGPREEWARSWALHFLWTQKLAEGRACSPKEHGRPAVNLRAGVFPCGGPSLFFFLINIIDYEEKAVVHIY